VNCCELHRGQDLKVSISWLFSSMARTSALSKEKSGRRGSIARPRIFGTWVVKLDID
jgi:hypothetical protein